MAKPASLVSSIVSPEQVDIGADILRNEVLKRIR